MLQASHDRVLVLGREAAADAAARHRPDTLIGAANTAVKTDAGRAAAP
jgi:hypothetical protein